MIATLPMPRIGARAVPPVELPALPIGARARGRLWSDAVFQAVLALQSQLTHRDAAVVMAAAGTLLDMERTRMRHSTQLAGSEDVSEAQEEFEAEREIGPAFPPRQPPPAPPVGPDPADAELLRGHAAEAAAAFAQHDAQRPVDERLGLTPERALAFVAARFRGWGQRAGDVAPGRFMATFRAKNPPEAP